MPRSKTGTKVVNADPLWFLGSVDRQLLENNVVRTIIEFLTFLQLRGM